MELKQFKKRQSDFRLIFRHIEELFRDNYDLNEIVVDISTFVFSLSQHKLHPGQVH